jgi:hypothetical protein
MKHPDPPLTLGKFDEKIKALQEVYDNNIRETSRIFQERTQKLFDRLSKEEQMLVVKRQVEKLKRTTEESAGTLTEPATSGGKKL